jgi:rhamnulokinase
MRILSVDLGASGGRVLAATLTDGSSGLVVSQDEIHRFAHNPVWVPRNGGRTLSWDALRMWEEIQTGLRKAGHEAGRPDSVGVDTWGVDFGLLDTRGALLANPTAYRDPRTDGMMERVFGIVPRDEIFQRTGLQFMQLNTLYQLFALSEQEPHLIPAIDRLLLMPDLFHYWLCGSRSVEYTNASTTQAVGAASRQWDEHLFQRLGLPISILPPIVEPGTRLGTVRADVAEELGLSSSTPVICPATHDTASAVVATPGEGANWAFLSAGTWCLFGAEVPQPYLDASVLEAGFSNEGGVRGTTRLLRNITGLWLVQECRRYWQSEGRDLTYGELAWLAEEAEPFRALIDPDDPAFAQPTRMPHAIAEYCACTGQAAPDGVGEFVRTALEGIALTVRLRWEQLQQILGRQFSVLHIVGGGTQNTLLCQLIADALGCPVIAGPTEATALGNALVQAVGHNALDYTEARSVVRRSISLTEYAPRETQAWGDAYDRFLAIRQAGTRRPG